MKKNKNYFNLSEKIRQYFHIQAFEDIITWAGKNIDFSGDISAQRNRLDFTKYCYQIDPIKEWEDFINIKTVTCVFPQQMGKTNIFIVGLLYSMVYRPSQSMIVYPSDQLAAETNVTKIQPLMRKIPQLKSELERPKSFRQDRYSFSNCISYFQGSGRKIVSKSCQIVVCDQIDEWQTIANVNNLHQADKRRRSYDSSIMFQVCSPTVQTGKIWQQFLKGSQGYYYLRCCNCFKLSMRSCDLNNLQFESEYNEELKEHIVKAGSERLVCPFCGYEHKEEQKAALIEKGQYIHKVPDRLKTHPSYQVGALASQLKSLCWSIIAQAQLAAGKRSDLESQMLLDNSFKGLPYKRRTIVKEDFQKLKEHCWTLSEAPSLSNVQMVFLIADTQDNRSVVGIFALDVNDNLFLIETKQPQYLMLNDEERNKINSAAENLSKQNGTPYIPVQTVQDMLNKEYLIENGVGIKPFFGLIDRQGHRTNEVQYFAEKNSTILMYQGSQMSTELWRLSDNNRKLYLANARHWKTNLIYYLYSQKKRGQSYLYLKPDISDQVIKQIVCVKPDPSKKYGDDPANWEPEHGAQHDWWDVVKMAYLAVDIAVKSFRYNRFRFGKSPSIVRRFEKMLNRKQQTTQQKDKPFTEQDLDKFL